MEFKSVQPTPVTLIIGESNDVTTDVTVEFEPETTDPSVSGKGLWDMSVWFSKSDTGAGSSTGMVESALSGPQKKQPVDLGDFEFSVSRERHEASQICCTAFRNIPSRASCSAEFTMYRHICCMITTLTPEPVVRKSYLNVRLAAADTSSFIILCSSTD